MNWEEIGKGEWLNNKFFEELSADQQIVELERALKLIAEQQRTNPAEGYRVASAALHLFDSCKLAKDSLRMSFLNALAVTAINLGKKDEAILQLRRILQQPFDPETEAAKAEAMVFLGSLIFSTNVEEATRLLRNGLASARRSGDSYLATNASITLGSLVKQTGDLQGARRIYEQAIADSKAADDHLVIGGFSILARLHGNLANLLTSGFQLHHQAIPHYQEAIRLFDEAGEPELAAQRWSQLISTGCLAGEFKLVLESLKETRTRINLAGEGFCRVFLGGMGWLLIPESGGMAWESFFNDLLNAPDLNIDQSTEASLIAACIILRAQAQDDTEVINLALRKAFQYLPESLLRQEATTMISEAAQKTGRTGIYWQLKWLLEKIEYAARVQCKDWYFQDEAALWLAEKVRLVRDQAISETEIIERAGAEPAIPGLAAVATGPPDWLNLNDPISKEIFSRLRVALCPSAEEVGQKLIETHSACTDQLGFPKADCLDLLYSHCKWADLSGSSTLMVSARTLLAQALSMQGGGLTPSSYTACLELLKEALSFADGLSREVIRVRIGLGTLLKEAGFGDEAARLDGAIAELEQALAIAKHEGFQDVIPKITIALGNALGEHPLAGEAVLEEAAQYLREGLAAVASAEAESRLIQEGVLYNSLGTLFVKLSEFGQSRERLVTAIAHLEKALARRETWGDQDRVLITLGNLVAARLKLKEAISKTAEENINAANEEIINLAERIRATARLANNFQSKYRSLLNAATTLKNGAYRESLDLGLDVLNMVKGKGLTRYLIETYLVVGEIHFHFGEYETACHLFEEAISILESFREAGGDSKYRAALSRNFQRLYDGLIKSLEMLKAPSDKLWWAVERNAGQTLIENMVTRGLITKPSKDNVIGELTEHLRTDCLLLQIYLVSNRINGFIISAGNQMLDIQPIGNSVSISEFSEQTGGKIEDGKIHFKICTPANQRDFTRQISWIGRNFLDPLLAKLDLAGITRIVIISQGFLNNIAWHAVPLSQQNARLGDIFEVVQIPSVSMLSEFINRPPNPIRKAVFVACDPEQNLVHYIEEVQQVFSTLEIPDKVLLTDKSRSITCDAFMEAIAEADLLHFSGHGIFYPGNPEQSGLLLSDGVVSVQKLEQSFSAYVPSLVVLSSCDSAIDDVHLSDAPTLSTVFLQAGARMVVGSAWPVPDIIAAETARRFYKWLTAMGPIKALSETRRSRSRIEGDDYWNSFKLLGWD
jgi:tetratricopeptide (TPR) repeat protein